MKNFIVLEKTERTLRLDPKGVVDEKRCFEEVKDLLDKYNWIEFCFNGRKVHLTKENYSKMFEQECVYYV